MGSCRYPNLHATLTVYTFGLPDLFLIKSAAFSAIAYTVAQVCVDGIMGTRLISPTLSPVTPYTRSSGLTTPAKWRGAIAADPEVCAVVEPIDRTTYAARSASDVMFAPGDVSDGDSCFCASVANHLRANLSDSTMISVSVGLMRVLKSTIGSA